MSTSAAAADEDKDEDGDDEETLYEALMSTMSVQARLAVASCRYIYTKLRTATDACELVMTPLRDMT